MVSIQTKVVRRLRRMVHPWEKFLVGYVLAFLVTNVVFAALKLSATGYSYAHLVRAQEVANINILMIAGDVLIVFYARHFVVRARMTTTVNQWLSAAIVCFLCAFLFCLFFGAHFGFFTYYVLCGTEPSRLAMLSLVAVGVWAYLVAFVFGFFALNVTVRTALTRDRCRHFLSAHPWLRAVLVDAPCQFVICIFFMAFLSLLSMYSATALAVKRMDIELRQLPEEFDGVTIAHLTDVHIGPSVGQRAVEKVVNMANELNPDIVTIVGDLVDGPFEDLKDAAAPLSRLRSRYGIFFALGNHELYYGKTEDWLRLFIQFGFNVLLNRNHHLKTSNDSSHYLCIAGLNDIYAEKFRLEQFFMDVEKTLQGCEQGHPIVLLAHNPVAAGIALDNSTRIDLILSGHTHAGQLYVVLPLKLYSFPFFWGLYRHSSGAQVYVSPGVHFWGSPMKIWNTAEITFITLRRASS